MVYRGVRDRGVLDAERRDPGRRDRRGERGRCVPARKRKCVCVCVRERVCVCERENVVQECKS